MKIITVIFMLILAHLYSYSQTDPSTYVIKTAGTTYTQQQVQTAIESATFCGYYYSDERHLLLFDDGTEVELKSHDELAAAGHTLDISCITPDKKENPVVWAISTNGTILRGGASQDKKVRQH